MVSASSHLVCFDQWTDHCGTGHRNSGNKFDLFLVQHLLSERGDNPRWVVDDRLRSRGDILDRNNQIIVTSINNNGNYQRWNEYPPSVVGYTNSIYGQAGIEASLYPYLRGIRDILIRKAFGKICCTTFLLGLERPINH